jgi:phosphatidylserine/phosphatidylglycerophosphate/cardiolipin synthase-like enzyme
LTVDGTDIETYFSPDDGVAARLVSVLNTAQESVYFMAYSFTSDDLGQTLRNLHSAGLTVKGVMDESQVKSNQGTEFDPFIQAGVDVRLDGISGLMHHKVMIIDRKIVVLGSYNFTASAENTNDENLLIIYNPQIAELFLAEFERVYAQGTVP